MEGWYTSARRFIPHPPRQRGRRGGVAPQQVPGGQIAHRQREAVSPVLQPKLALIVRCPDVVGSLGNGLGTPRVRRRGPPLAAVVPKLLEPGDPLVGCLPGDAKPFRQFANGVVVQLVVFQEPLSLLAHGNTFPRHGWDLLGRECHPWPSTT